MTPNILHQLWLGLFKTHILAWMQWSLGKDELDKRFMTMPEAQGLRLFSSGVSGIGQWTGCEAREMAKQMLCAVAGSVDNEEAELACIGIKFMSYAELPTMRESDVAEMEQLLTEFHDLKWIMVDKEFGYYKNESSFNAVPKLHMITHYGASVRLYGTLNGFNSKVPKNLHIHYAKKPWQALNKVRPEKQMMVYIQRQEAIRIHWLYMNLYCGIAVKDADAGKGADVELEQREYAKGDLEQEGGVQTIEDPASVLPCRQPWPSQVWYPNPHMTIAKNPTHDKVPCRTVINKYGAKDFIELLTKLLANQFDTPAYKSLLLENHQYAVWHQLYLKHPCPPFAIGWPHTDIIWANPPPCNVAGTRIRLGTYNVVLVLDKPGAGGIHWYCAARVRVIFKLPTTHLQGIYNGHLAYIELFNPFLLAPSPSAPCLYTTLHLLRGNGQRKHAIVQVSNIKLACHLAPQFDQL
ncbi:hypothetical protein RhiXN_05677 [Rhizoctonia solani]|uniref:Uncharacterized protein n=1 Tax=Rhizoctonia solani TaxID=456999 RepID=A0A8H8NXH2_9AGAM|nr:uncharacterized protein RhiXN_05677 [Rhizoctonia solani]QRW20688.1 hypothetical protein RhiXN_05677 [Rhizoctonia solani]